MNPDNVVIDFSGALNPQGTVVDSPIGPVEITD